MAIARELVTCREDAMARQLLHLMNEHTGPPSVAAAFLLAEWANDGFVMAGAVPAAVRGLAHPSAEVRQWCATILRGIGVEARDAVVPLLETLKDPDAGVRQAAVNALGHVAGDDEQVLVECVKLLCDEEPVRNAVVRMLAGPAGPRDTVCRAVARLFRAREGRFRAGAAAAAGVLLESRPDFVPYLIKSLEDLDVNVRALAARALSELREPGRAVVLALGKALRDVAPAVRQQSARALDIFGPAAAPAVPYLVAVLKDSDATVRFYAVEALEELAPRQPVMLPAVVLALSNRLIDADAAVQTRALSAFSKLAPHAFPLNPNLKAAIHSPDPEIRLAAVEAVAQIQHEGLEIREILHKALLDRSGAVRVAAALALAKRNDIGDDVVATLIGAVREPSARVQIAAIQALREIGRGARGALAALEAKLEDSNPDVRHLAELAINQLTGDILAQSGT